MGWGWSLHIAQKDHEFRVAQTQLDLHHRILDQRPGARLFGSSSCHAIYVDNYCVISGDREVACNHAAQIRYSLIGARLPVHEIVEGAGELDFVGLHLDGEQHEVRMSWRRVWRLRLALDYLIQHRRCSEQNLEKILGHCTWSALLRRESLCIFGAVYKFARLVGERKALLWPSVLRELRQFSSLIPLLISQLWIPWSPQVYVTDASDF